VAARQRVSELGCCNCARERENFELVSIDYSHLGNRPGRVNLIPLQLGVRSGLVEAHSSRRALST
jgi:hypothetical protein